MQLDYRKQLQAEGKKSKNLLFADGMPGQF
jgi:hypothetical protein